MYLVLHMPFVLLIVASLQNNISNASTKRTMVIAFSFYALTQAGHVYGIIKRSNSEIIYHHAHIVKKYQVDKTDRIIAPAVFVFNEIENARITASEMINILVRSNKLSLRSEDTFKYARQHDYKYLVLKSNYRPEFQDSDLTLGNIYFDYRLVGLDHGYYIFRQNN